MASHLFNSPHSSVGHGKVVGAFKVAIHRVWHCSLLIHLHNPYHCHGSRSRKKSSALQHLAASSAHAACTTCRATDRQASFEALAKAKRMSLPPHRNSVEPSKLPPRSQRVQLPPQPPYHVLPCLDTPKCHFVKTFPLRKGMMSTSLTRNRVQGFGTTCRLGALLCCVRLA